MNRLNLLPDRADLGRYASVTAMAVIVLLPLAIMVSTSLKTQAQTFGTGFTFFAVPTLDNYRSVLEGRFLGYLGNSIVVGIGATAITLLLATMCAYALSRLRFTGRTSIAIGSLLLRTIPPAVLAVPVYFIWNRWGIGD